ncbi:hypothetical protein Glove_141g106 [Diversispora epigaea]|uniref:Uncharacterized protein n=1 Tax=Diversispora epigaea TaxID=1348612 RepID=A0A397IUR1_9GLOM|nr:hypothetical protein Glove_141g106 [Diversispora epigaea]
MGRIHKEYYSASARYLTNEAIREIKGSMGNVPDAINAMAKKYRINYYRVLDYIENRERKQQIIQSTVSNQIESEVLLQSKSLGNELKIQGSASSLNHDSSILHLESTSLPNTEIKKRNSKSQSKSVRTSNQSSVSKGSFDKVDKLLETIPPEISQETEDPLELFKRTQKDAKKSRAVARADISKLSNSKV